MNRFMKKFKAVYCNASFIFAIAVLMVTNFIMHILS